MIFERGDVGILQNVKICFDGVDRSYLNGTLVEVVGNHPERGDYSVRLIPNYLPNFSRGEYKGTVGILKHQIRPIDDPDQDDIEEVLDRALDKAIEEIGSM